MTVAADDRLDQSALMAADLSLEVSSHGERADCRAIPQIFPSQAGQFCSWTTYDDIETSTALVTMLAGDIAVESRVKESSSSSRDM